MSLTSFYVLIYLLVLLGIAVVSSRRESSGEYINAGKNLSAIRSTWTTFASLITGYNFVLGVTFSYLYGFWYLLIFVGAALAFVVLYFFYKKRLQELQKQQDLLSVGDYFGLRYGAVSQHIVNWILLGGLLLFLTLQMYVNTGLFSTLLGVQKITALLLTAGVVGGYLCLGGFKASVSTDVFQGFLMLPIVLIVFVFPSNFTLDKISSALDYSQFWFAVGLALLQFFSLLGQAESFQRIFAVRDLSSLKRGLIWAFLLLSGVSGAIAYVGINFRFTGINVQPSDLFTSSVLGALPNWLESLLIISLIAAFMGTIDSSAFAFGVLAARCFKGKNVQVRIIQVFTVLGIFIAAIASLFFYSLLTPAFALISLISVIGAAVLASLLFELRSSDIVVFLLVGTITFVLGILLTFINEDPLTALIPIGVAYGVLLIILCLRAAKEKPKLNALLTSPEKGA